MIVTKKWLNEFIDLSDVSTEKLVETLNKIGLEVEGVKEIKIPDNVVVGYVTECEKHPNADKLNLCKVDVGEDNVQIICGAKNVEAGQYVPVAKIGAILPDDFKIKKAKLRGIESFGMICAAREIGLADINDGILVLDDSIGKLEIGKNLNEYDLFDDVVIEIGLTANRGDCLSIYGVARDLSAALNKELKTLNLSYENDFKEGIGRIAKIENENLLSSHLIKAININELKLPLKIALRLSFIDNLKDNTLENIKNYVIHSTGVILNLFEKGNFEQEKDKIIIHLKNKNDFDELSGKELLYKVGVKEYSPLDKSNGFFIIDANYIDPDIISEKVQSKKEKTDDIFYRSSRGSEYDLRFGMDYLCYLLKSYSKCDIYSGEFDLIKDINPVMLNISVDDINRIIGDNIEKDIIINILKKLRFNIDVNDKLNITVPIFRHDIKNKFDIAEEILRIYGIDNIKSIPLKFEEKNRQNQAFIEYKNKNILRIKSVANGFFETLSYVFDSKEDLEKYKFETIDDKLDLLNPIVNEFNTLRTTLLLQLVRFASNNLKNGHKKISLFQLGSVYDKNRNETQKIAFIETGLKESDSIFNNGKGSKVDFYSFANKLINVIGNFELVQTNQNDSFFHPYIQAKIIQNNKEIGFIAKLHPNVVKDFDLEDSFVAEIELNSLLKENQYIAQNVIKYPKVTRDLSIVVSKDINYLTIKQSLDKLVIDELKGFYPVDIYDLGDENSLTIRFFIQSSEKTLTDEEINDIINKIIENLSKIGAELR